MQRHVLLAGAVAGWLALGAGAPSRAATTAEEPKSISWTFQGMAGRFDQAQLQRGYKVYAEVCSSCHSMNLLAYRNLAQQGGPFFDKKYQNPAESPYAKALAAAVQVADIDTDTGDAKQRPGTPADHFKPPFANEAAARAANGGALPPGAQQRRCRGLLRQPGGSRVAAARLLRMAANGSSARCES